MTGLGGAASIGPCHERRGFWMRTVLCYGDSNTWGSDPETGERFAPEVRWPGVLARGLGEGFRVVEEGLSGRTTVRRASTAGK